MPTIAAALTPYEYGDIESNNIEEYDDNYQSRVEHDSYLHLWRNFVQASNLISIETNADVLKCFDDYINFLHDHINSNVKYCPVKHDGVSCWPATEPGTVSVVSCFEEFLGIAYDSTGKLTHTLRKMTIRAPIIDHLNV